MPAIEHTYLLSLLQNRGITISIIRIRKCPQGYLAGKELKLMDVFKLTSICYPGSLPVVPRSPGCNVASRSYWVNL